MLKINLIMVRAFFSLIVTLECIFFLPIYLVVSPVVVLLHKKVTCLLFRWMLFQLLMGFHGKINMFLKLLFSFSEITWRASFMHSMFFFFF